jgi:hypothetical protein
MALAVHSRGRKVSLWCSQEDALTKALTVAHPVGELGVVEFDALACGEDTGEELGGR